MKTRSLLAALAASTLATGALAQTAVAPFPSKPLRLVVGFPPGGAADVLTRVMARALGKQLGQQVIVDNKPGADGIIAANEVLRAPPDGHTLMPGTNAAMVLVPSARPNVPTAKELGLGNLTILPWAGFFGSANLPPAVRDRLSAELQKALAQPEVKAQLAQQGFDGYGIDVGAVRRVLPPAV